MKTQQPVNGENKACFNAFHLKTDPDKGVISISRFEALNFRGIQKFEHDFSKEPQLTLCGKNGAGKSSVMDSFLALLFGLKDAPDEVRRADNLVGPFGKKAVVRAKLENLPAALKMGESLWLNMSITRGGTVKTTLTDEETGEIHSTAPREKIKKFLNRFIDPTKLLERIKKRNGARELAAELAQMVGLDLSPYIKTEEGLADSLKLEEREKKRQREALKGLSKPQADWPTARVDPSAITAELESLRELQARNYEKTLKIAAAWTEAEQADQDRQRLAEEIPKLAEDFEQARKETREGKNALVVKKAELKNLRDENDKKPWKGRSEEAMEEEIAALEAQIKAVRQEQRQKREFDKGKQDEKLREREMASLISNMSARIESRQKTAEEKLKTWTDKQSELKRKERDVKDMEKRAVDLETSLPLEAWTGDRDPAGELFPSGRLKTRLQKAEKDNELFRLREEYERAGQSLKDVETLIQTLKQNRKANQAMKDMAVAQVAGKLPVPGMSLSEDTVLLDMGEVKGTRSINDLSDGERLAVCCHIIIFMNEIRQDKLRFLLVRDGAKLDPDNLPIVARIAAENGYGAIIETIQIDAPGAARIVEGKMAGINPAVPVEQNRETREVAAMPNF